MWYFDRCFLKLASACSFVSSCGVLMHQSTCRLVSSKVPHAKQRLWMELSARLRRYRVGAHSLMNLEICSLWPSWSALIDCPWSFQSMSSKMSLVTWRRGQGPVGWIGLPGTLVLGWRSLLFGCMCQSSSRLGTLGGGVLLGCPEPRMERVQCC